MKVLMVDVGGTNVKVMASYECEMRTMSSGERLTASEMVRGVLEVASDLEFDRVSLGFPGLVEQGKPVLEPRNFGDEWVGFYRCGSDLIKLARKEPLVDRLSKAALERDGNERWKEAVVEAEELLQSVFKPDETVLGGGNAKLVDPLPANCRCVDNRSAYIGVQRLWEGSDLFASACATSWRVHRNEAHI
jgi:polyphosphate glucokinase